eukprot:SAG25_NODE_11121_length_313_cov_0.728972_1_plen_87_part_01
MRGSAPVGRLGIAVAERVQVDRGGHMAAKGRPPNEDGSLRAWLRRRGEQQPHLCYARHAPLPRHAVLRRGLWTATATTPTTHGTRLL